MSEAKHTPGPWFSMDDRDGNIRGLRGRHGPESVNVVNWNGISRASSANGQANARLISAAPELLEALEAITALYDTDEGCRSIPEYTAARAAIAKAKGPTQQ